MGKVCLAMDRVVIYEKTPNTALFSLLNQSFTKVSSLISKASKALSLTFSHQRLENMEFSGGHYLQKFHPHQLGKSFKMTSFPGLLYGQHE